MAGRPTKVKYWMSEDGLKLLTHYKRNDMTDKEIALDKIGISPSTLDDWKARYPQISKALKKGLEFCVADAEEALLTKFKPYTYKEQSVETWEEYNPKTGKMETRTHKKITERTALPDTAAIIFFLKAKGGWRENNEIVDNSQVRRVAETLANVGTIQ